MKIKSKKIFIIILSIIMCTCLFVGYSVFAKNKDINLPKNIWLEVGETYGFEQIGDKTDWSFYSINEQVVSVNDGGVVYANNIGETLVVLSKDGKDYHVKFYVTETVYNVVLDYTDVSLKVGDNKKITATLYENGQVSTQKPIWKLVDDRIVDITEENGAMIILAKRVGGTIVEVTFGKAKAVCNVRVMDGSAEILSAPILSVDKCGTVSWGAVEGAKAYAVKFNNGNWFETSKTSVECESLAEQLVDFKVSVRALAKDSTDYYDGDYSTIEIKHDLAVEKLDKDLSCKEVTGAKIFCQICERYVIDNDYILPHAYKDGVCEICGQIQTANIQYKFNDNSYVVIGVTDDYVKANKEIYISSTFNDGEHGLRPVTAIGDGAFKNFVYLKKVVLPESVTSIGENAFESCAALEEITMTGVKELSSSKAFYRCVSLQRMIVGKNFAVTGSVFSCLQKDAADYTARCDVLVCATENESKINVSHSSGNFGFTGKVAYYDNKGCSNVTWHYNKYGGVEYMTHTFINGSCQICGAHDENGLAYKYNAEKDGYVLQGLGNFFEGTEIVVPESYNDGVHGLKSVVSVESEAFISGTDRYGYSILNISSIILPDTVTELGVNAFYGTSKLKHLEIPGVINLPSQSLYKSAVQTLVVNPNVSLQGKVAYNENLDLAYNCTLLVKGDSLGSDFNLSNNSKNNLFSEVKYFYSQDNDCFAWSYVNGKAKINEHNYVNEKCSICGAVKSEYLVYFYNQESDSYEVSGFVPEIISTVVDVSATYDDCVHGEKPVTYILPGAFINNAQIVRVNLGGITDIGYYAFYGCSKIESISIPNCTSITGKYQFSLCDAVAAVFLNPKFNASGTVFSYSDEKMNKKCVAYILGDEISDDFDLGLSSNAIFGAAYLRDLEQSYMCETWHYGLDSKPMIEKHEYIDGICRKCNMSDKYSYDLLLDGYVINKFDQEEISKNIVIPATVNGLYGEKAVIGVGDSVFFNNTEIESVTFGKHFISIGESAFEGCTALKEINFNENSTIGKNAFKGCSSLESVTFGKNTQVGISAFENCTALKELNFPKLTGLDVRAFAGCTALEKVVFPLGKENAFNIGNNVFENCKALKYVDIRNISVLGGEDTIGQTAYTTGKDIFYNCIALETVVVGHRFCVESRQFALDTSVLSEFTPKAILYVDMKTSTSEQYSNLKTGFKADSSNIILTGKAYVNGIGKYNGVTYIDGTTNSTWKLVEGCPVGVGHPRFGEPVNVKLNVGKDNEFSVSLYSWVGWLETMPMQDHKFVDGVCACGEIETDSNGYKYSSADGGYVLVSGKNFTDQSLVIPAEYEGLQGKHKVVAIGEEAFKNNTTITEVIFPEGIEIGRYAFGYCTGITELNFPKLAGIGVCAFEGCTGLTKVEFPQGGKNAFNIGEAAFYNCTSLKYVDIRNVGIFGGTDSYEEIEYTTGRDIFSGCIGLETFIVGHRFIVNDRTFPIGGAQVTNFTPKAILYVDMTTKVSSQNSNVKLNMGEGGTYNVLLSGKMYINGMSGCVDGETEGTWKMTENGPEGIGHPRIGTETTGSHGGYTFTRYDHTGYWETTNIEPHNYDKNDVCTICGDNKYGTLTYSYNADKGGYVLINDDNFTGEIVNIPAEYEGLEGKYNVVAIGENAFKNNTTITEVEFPEGIEIGRYAFGYCTGITELNFPKLAGIGVCAFEGCTGLTKVEFPQGGKNAFNIGEAAFYNCTSLKYVDIRNVGIFGGTDSYEEIEYTTGRDIFSGCIGLETFIVGHRFIVNDRTFPIGGAQVTNFTPKAILYVDMTTKVSSQNSNVKLNMGEGGTYNVLLSGKMYINGMSGCVDGETEGTWKMTENGPEGIGHPRIGTETTGSHGGYTFTRYDHTGYWEDTNIEACNYDENGECTVCKKIEEEQN